MSAQATIIQSATSDRAPSLGTHPPLVTPPAPHAPPSTPRRGVAILIDLWRPLIIFLAGLACIVTALELSLPKAAPLTTLRHRYDPRTPAPYVEFRSTPGVDIHLGESHIVTNDLGFRDDPLPLEKRDGERRIFFISSSVGFQASTNDKTIAALIERKLHDNPDTAGQNIRVVNAANVSYNMRQSLVLLVTTLLDYQPDVIVLFQGTESLLFPPLFESRPGYPYNFIAREKAYQAELENADHIGLATRILRKSAMIRTFHPNLIERVAASDAEPFAFRKNLESADDCEPYIDETVRDMGKIANIAASAGCPLVMALPPIRNNDVPAFGVEALSHAVEQLCADRGDNVRYVDTVALGEELDAISAWSNDLVHWNDRGNQIMAEALAEALLAPPHIDALR